MPISKNRRNAFFNINLDEILKFNTERKQMGLEILKFRRSNVVNVKEVYKMFID